MPERGELFYLDAAGKQQDAKLHEEILAGDHDDALEVTRERLRAMGWADDVIADFLGENRPSARSRGAAARAARLAAVAFEESQHPRGPSAPGHSSGEFKKKGNGEAGAGGGEEKQVGVDVGGDKKASPEVPESLVKAIEDHVEAMAGRGSRAGAADLSKWLCLTHGDEIEKLVDSYKQEEATTVGTTPRFGPILLLHKGDTKKGVPTMWLLTWSKNDITSIHDHLESEVGVSVLRGNVGNRAYSTGEGYLDKAKSKEGLESRFGEQILKPKQTVQIKSPYIHEMYGTAESGQKRDITVHAYYPPLSHMHYFRKDKDGKLHYAGDWDEDREPQDCMIETGEPTKGPSKATASMGFCPCCSVKRELARWGADAPRHEPSARSRRAEGRAARLAAIAWDESKHKRGKTSPGTTPGSFAPEGGGEEGGGEAKREKAAPERKTTAVKPSIANADKIKAAWVAASPHTSVDSLVEHAPADQGELVTLAQQIERDTGAKLHNPGIKKRERIEEKLKLAGRKPQSISDAVRLGFEVSSPEQADAIIDRLKQKYLVADEGWQMKPVGYFDRKVTLRFADGMMGEVQLWPTIMLVAKQTKGHALYERARTLPPGPAKEEANREMSSFYHGLDVPRAWKDELGRFGS